MISVPIVIMSRPGHGWTPLAMPREVVGMWVGLVTGPRDCRARAADQEVEVAALIGLENVLGVQPDPAAAGLLRRRGPGGAAEVEFGVIDLEVQRPGRHVQANDVAGPDERDRAADRRLRRGVQYDSPVR